MPEPNIIDEFLKCFLILLAFRAMLTREGRGIIADTCCTVVGLAAYFLIVFATIGSISYYLTEMGGMKIIMQV